MRNPAVWKPIVNVYLNLFIESIFSPQKCYLRALLSFVPISTVFKIIKYQSKQF